MCANVCLGIFWFQDTSLSINMSGLMLSQCDPTKTHKKRVVAFEPILNIIKNRLESLLTITIPRVCVSILKVRIKFYCQAWIPNHYLSPSSFYLS
jgi:hypothetical protein